MKKVQSNVMLLVLFIMLISSFLGLLVTQYVRDMIVISGLFTKYYTTYFHAYGGLEMGLSLINYRLSNDIDKQNPFGYEDEVFFAGFNNCQTGSCGFTMDIQSRGSLITDSTALFDDCAAAITADTEDNRTLYTIGGGDGFIIPLFFDRSSGFSVVDYEVILGDNDTPSQFEDLDPQLYSRYEGVGSDEQYIVRIIDEEVLNYNHFLEPDVGNGTIPESLAASGLVPYEGSAGTGSPLTGQNKNYLVIANATGAVKQFCLQLDGVGPGSTAAELPQKFMRIESIAENENVSVAFRAIKTNQLPSYLIYGTINP